MSKEDRFELALLRILQSKCYCYYHMPECDKCPHDEAREALDEHGLLPKRYRNEQE